MSRLSRYLVPWATTWARQLRNWDSGLESRTSTGNGRMTANYQILTKANSSRHLEATPINRNHSRR